jgi:hypothetical protein
MNISVIVFVLGLAQHPAMPAGMSHEQHQQELAQDAELKRRGAAAMGFDQDATTHRFVLEADGGVIQVTVKDATDAQNLAAIRAHLRQIAKDFADGVFEAPFATHAEAVPGVPVMQRLRDRITYRYEQMPEGGRVRIVASLGEARDAVHAFLRYQIREHKTGDVGVR